MLFFSYGVNEEFYGIAFRPPIIYTEPLVVNAQEAGFGFRTGSGPNAAGYRFKGGDEMIRMVLAAFVAAFLYVPAGAFVSQLIGKTINLENQIVCFEKGHIRKFFDFAFQFQGEGIGNALAAAHRRGIKCVIAQGAVVYKGVKLEYVYVAPHGELSIKVHEIETPKGTRFFWTTNKSGDGA